MPLEKLSKELAGLRDEAHRLSQEKLASAESDAGRLKRAQEVDQRLRDLQSDIEAAPANERATLNDIVQIARRYLIFLLMEAGTGEPKTALDRARKLHNDIIAAAKAATAGTLEGEHRGQKAAALSAAFQDLLADPGRGEPEVQRILGDIDLDLEFVRHGGGVPSSLRLARELMP